MSTEKFAYGYPYATVRTGRYLERRGGTYSDGKPVTYTVAETLPLSGPVAPGGAPDLDSLDVDELLALIAG